MANRLSHVDSRGKARMVDVGDKPVTHRQAHARGEIVMSAEALRLIRRGAVAKGDPLLTARLAGVMAAKQTATLSPLCTHCTCRTSTSISRRRGGDIASTPGSDVLAR